MVSTPDAVSVASERIADVDVLIVGAGLSGIGAAAHLTMQCPGKSYAIVEQRADMGGTWDLFRYPGIRSDSDMHTLGYRFKPWLHEKTIADGPAIWDYVRETAEEFNIKQHIHFRHRVIKADWSSADATWTVTARREEDGAEVQFRANFLFMCAGYYNYDEGYKPDFPGEENFKGQVIHPQHWPDDFDHAGKKVIVIGSGATAVTIVPVMAQTAAKVTMLQRSPTYMVSRPAIDPFSRFMRKILPEKIAYAVTRWRNINWQRLVYWRARSAPDKMAKTLLDEAREAMPGYENFETDFVPRYGPWEQRLCLVPDADMFDAINKGKVQVVTDHIDHWTETGIKLKSGKELEADVIVTATGLNLVLLGQTDLSVDGKPINLADHVNYKGVMFNDIPNMASVFGYVNASWTLKTDIVADYVCRLLNVMDAKGAKIANPHLDEPGMPRLPFVEDFSSSYFARSFDKLPKNGDRHPWRVLQNYAAEKKILTKDPVDDGVMIFSNASAKMGDSADTTDVMEAAE
ncbi:flavin-containing monooxygenase [Sphingorhabdus arenilitoris]|uniref:Flavin-containing monooxygenase n=1 Tax=Sphingorhabdus arenilitoris TaxID=1490041 RepID=A0ABV8RE55_9SPHN